MTSSTDDCGASSRTSGTLGVFGRRRREATRLLEAILSPEQTCTGATARSASAHSPTARALALRERRAHETIGTGNAARETLHRATTGRPPAAVRPAIVVSRLAPGPPVVRKRRRRFRARVR